MSHFVFRSSINMEVIFHILVLAFPIAFLSSSVSSFANVNSKKRLDLLLNNI